MPKTLQKINPIPTPLSTNDVIINNNVFKLLVSTINQQATTINELIDSISQLSIHTTELDKKVSSNITDIKQNLVLLADAISNLGGF